MSLLILPLLVGHTDYNTQNKPNVTNGFPMGLIICFIKCNELNLNLSVFVGLHCTSVIVSGGRERSRS